MNNVVHAEFFHVDVGEAPALEVLLAECAERLSDSHEFALQGKEHSLGIKTVVDFMTRTMP